MSTFRTDSLHFASFLLCDNFRLVDVHLINPQKGLVEFEFERRSGIDVKNLYQSWSFDGYQVPCRSIFQNYLKLRELLEQAKKEKCVSTK
jgi:hypothetical protein